MPAVSLLPGSLDLAFYRGDDETFQVTMTEGGSPAVLSSTGWTAQIRARATADSPVLASLTIDTTDAATGVLKFSIAGTETLILPKKAKWDLQCDTPAVRTYLAGDVLTTDQVTQ